MPTKLTGTLKREVRVYGIEQDVIAKLTEEGIEMSMPGFKNKISGTWEEIAKALHTPKNVLSYLEGRPIDFLKHQASKLKV